MSAYIQSLPSEARQSADSVLEIIENVDQRTLEGGHPNDASGVPSFYDTTAQVRKVSYRGRGLDRNEFQVAEGEGPGPLACGVVEAVPERVDPTVELQRRVVGNDGFARRPNGPRRTRRE